MPGIHTPCIGVCSTTYGGDVCRGCRRFAHEVVGWNTYSDAQKQLVWDRLERLVTEVAGTQLEVQDAELLAGTLRTMGIRFHEDRSPLFGAMELLRALGSQQVDTRRFGLAVHTTSPMTPGAIHRALGEDMFRRSEAWYDLLHGRAGRRLSALD